MEAIVEYNYEAQEPDELTLKKGDIITEIKVMVGGWWEGKLKDKRGMFPDNFVKVLEPLPSGTMKSTGSEGASSTKSDEVPLKNGGSRRRFCKVLFHYEPCNKDELTLVPQDTIEFLGEVEEGWWRGRLKGRVGVFPSNFVSPPVYEEPEKHKEQESKKLCKVLFPYEAANADELTLNEGDIITLLNTNASDKGWWIGELNGRVGLFPDNFVEVISVPADQDYDQKHKSIKSISKHSHLMKKNEKVHAKKNLDIQDTGILIPNVHTEAASKRTISLPTPATSTSPGVGGSAAERKSLSGHSISSSLKRLVVEGGTNNGNENTNVALGEELDGVERGEGAPLSHLTASRAKAPRRRPPSSQRLRRHASGSTTMTTTPEDNLANGNADAILEEAVDEPEGLIVKARRKAPWLEELNLIISNQLNKAEENKAKDKSPSQKADMSPPIDPSSITPDSPIVPPYVPFALYNQLLKRVIMLEEKQEVMQQTLKKILEEFVPVASLANRPD